MKAQPPADLGTDGFRRMRATNALDWCRTTRGLLDGKHVTTVQLSVVAFTMCLDHCLDLVGGFSRQYKDGSVTHVPGDRVARADLPVDTRRLKVLQDRGSGIRERSASWRSRGPGW